MRINFEELRAPTSEEAPAAGEGWTSGSQNPGSLPCALTHPPTLRGCGVSSSDKRSGTARTEGAGTVRRPGARRGLPSTDRASPGLCGGRRTPEEGLWASERGPQRPRGSNSGPLDSKAPTLAPAPPRAHAQPSPRTRQGRRLRAAGLASVARVRGPGAGPSCPGAHGGGGGPARPGKAGAAPPRAPGPFSALPARGRAPEPPHAAAAGAPEHTNQPAKRHAILRKENLPKSRIFSSLSSWIFFKTQKHLGVRETAPTHSEETLAGLFRKPREP